MIFPYMTFSDGTEVVHSGIEMVNNLQTVRVYFEKPVESGFFTAECLLPSMSWSKVRGFTGLEVAHMQDFINRQADLFFEFASQPEAH